MHECDSILGDRINTTTGINFDLAPVFDWRQKPEPLLYSLLSYSCLFTPG